jgi:hypothetical protein
MFPSHGVFLEKKTKYEERVPTIEELRARMNLDKFKDSKADQPVYNDQIQNNEETKKRKEELVRGQKNLLKGIYGNVNTSVYQDIYK